MLPLILAGGAAAVLLGGKKKRSTGGGEVPLDRPIQVKKDGLVVNSGRSPVPPAVKEAPLEPFNDVQQVQEGLIAAGKPLKHGADGKWGPESQGALDAYNAESGFKNEAKAHLATPDSLRSLHRDAARGTANGKLASVTTGIGTLLWCDISKMECPKDHECIPLWAEGQAPKGYEDVGVCIPRRMIEAGYIPGPDAYAPGGFNRVVFSPDYEEVAIGKGWRFQTLEPWLYERMKSGKLLTYALEGSLFWEDLISKSPKDFWNSTLASVGLAVPAGAAVGTKGWLSYRSAFRSEIPIKETVRRSRERIIRTWQGPKGFFPGDTADAIKGGYLNYWPPPDDVVEEWAGWRVTENVPGERVVLTEPDGIHKGKLQPYGGMGELHHGHPQTMRIELVRGAAAPKGMEMYRISIAPSGGPGKTIAASSLEEAVDMAEEIAGGKKVRAQRMLALWGDDRIVTESFEEVVNTGRMSIKWARPQFRQVAKSIGVPLAVAAVIGATVYGADSLVRKLADKQRDLIAESAALAWKDFSKEHVVRVGNQKVRIDQLPDTIAVQFFQAYVAEQILRFQKSTYE